MAEEQESLESLIKSGRAKKIRTIKHDGRVNLAREAQRERELGHKTYVHERYTEIYEILSEEQDQSKNQDP